MAFACSLLALPSAWAQREPLAVPRLPQWELRVDGTAAREGAAHAGVGLNVRAGYYARLGVALSAGASQSVGNRDRWVGSQRADATVRFLLDPFTEERRGLYGGAGVSVRHDDGELRPALVLVAGLEGRPRRGVLTSVELAVGGGVRLGFVWRRARPGRSR